MVNNNLKCGDSNLSGPFGGVQSESRMFLLALVAEKGKTACEKRVPCDVRRDIAS